MVFLGIVPLAFAAFGNYVVPLMIGAPDMAFPRVNMASYQAYFLGGVVMLVSFFIPGGAAQAGWTSYSPLATTIPTHGQAFWLIGMVLLITSSLLGAVNFIAHHHPVARAGHDVDAAAVVRLGAIRDGVPAAARVSAARSRGRHAIDGQRCAHEFLFADRTGGGRSTRQRQRRRQPVALAAFVLVPRPSGSLCFDSAGDGHRLRNHRQQHAQADLGLQIPRVFGACPSVSCRSSSGRTTCI